MAGWLGREAFGEKKYKEVHLQANLGWVDFDFGCSTLLPSCSARSANFTSAQAESGPIKIKVNPSQPNRRTYLYSRSSGEAKGEYFCPFIIIMTKSSGKKFHVVTRGRSLNHLHIKWTDDRGSAEGKEPTLAKQRAEKKTSNPDRANQTDTLSVPPKMK